MPPQFVHRVFSSKSDLAAHAERLWPSLGMSIGEFNHVNFDKILIFDGNQIITSSLCCYTSKNKGKFMILQHFCWKMDFEVDLGNRRIEKVKECLAWWTLFFTYQFRRFSQKWRFRSFSRATVMFCQKCHIFGFRVVHFGIQALFCLYLVGVKRIEI